MIPFEDIKIFLPKYLSPQSEENLFKALKNYPKNLDDKMYTSYRKDEDIVFQGDGFKDLLVINFPNPRVDRKPAMILSNSCDINPSNKRLFDANACYTPIFNINKYMTSLLKKDISLERVKQHIKNIKEQLITQIFYLPKNGILEEDSFIFFDKIISSPISYLPKNQLNKTRLFTLGDYGLYLFIFKLSIHFTRMQEDTSRESS